MGEIAYQDFLNPAVRI